MGKMSATAVAALETAAALEKAARSAANVAERDSAMAPEDDGDGGEEQKETRHERKARKAEEQMRPCVSDSHFKLVGERILDKLEYTIYLNYLRVLVFKTMWRNIHMHCFEFAGERSRVQQAQPHWKSL